MAGKISVVIPTYNERDNIVKIIDSLEESCSRDIKEIIIVDDNSPDGTWKVVEELKKKIKKLRLIRRIRANGLPSAIIEGIRSAKCEYILWMDSDLSHPPKLIRKMMAYIDDYDVVSASRYVKGGKDRRGILRVATSRALNLFGSMVLNIGVKDITSGFYLVKKHVFKKIKLKDHGYAEYCIKFTWDVKREGYKIKEVPYTVIDREKGYSKSYKNFANFMKHGCLCIKEILALRFMNKY